MLKFYRAGKSIKVKVASSINWEFEFSNDRSTEADAEAIMTQLQEKEDAEINWRDKRIERLKEDTTRLSRSNSALRGLIRRMKGK